MTDTQELIETLEADARIKGGNLIRALARIAELEKAQTAPAQRLSDDQLWTMWNAQGIDEMDQQEAIAFARKVEAAILVKE